MSIQIFLALNRLDLRQDRRDDLVVALDRDRFTATGVRPISHRHDDDTRFSANTASNSKRLIERPTLLVCVEDERTGAHGKANVQPAYAESFGVASAHLSPDRQDFS